MTRSCSSRPGTGPRGRCSGPQPPPSSPSCSCVTGEDTDDGGGVLADGFLMPVRDLDNLHTESMIKWHIADTGWWATWCWTAGPSGWSRPYRCGSPPFWNPSLQWHRQPCFLHYRLLLWNLNNSAHNIHSSELKWPGTNNTAIATDNWANVTYTFCFIWTTWTTHGIKMKFTSSLGLFFCLGPVPPQISLRL